MENNVCEVSINGQDYFLPCDRVGDLSYQNGYLVNVSSSSLTLRSEFAPTTQYPYVSCSSMAVCQLRLSQQNTQYVQSNFEYKGDYFKISNFDLLIFATLFITLGVRLLWKH